MNLILFGVFLSAGHYREMGVVLGVFVLRLFGR